MSGISTCQQKVDAKKFHQGFDSTYQKKRKKDPGTRRYVANKSGELVERNGRPGTPSWVKTGQPHE